MWTAILWGGHEKKRAFVILDACQRVTFVSLENKAGTGRAGVILSEMLNQRNHQRRTANISNAADFGKVCS